MRQLRADLEDTKITAPCSGTVTAVYAKVGNSGGGLLFVIEDIEDLVIETSVKGYDIGTVQTGMNVNIYSDATGDKEIKGVISSIAPTTKKNSQGTTDTTSETTFAAEVAVTTKDIGLRIGMDVDLDYIVAEESDVFIVPYDAVYENCKGQECVLIASKTAQDQYTISELTVATGVSNDLDIIISGENVVEGLRVAIARAMANDPAIILADEPTGALNSKTDRMVMDLFHKLNEEQGKTIVLITHNRELAGETDRILTMRDGLLYSGHEKGGL